MKGLEWFNLEGKVALVTGGARGLGRSMAIALAECGTAIALADLLGDELEKTGVEIRNLGKPCCTVTADVTSPNEVNKLVTRVISEFGKVDILINNAGVGRTYVPIENVTPKEWLKVMDTNLTAVLFCCQRVGREMISRRYGKIINVASISGLRIGKDVIGGSYDVSKLGVIGLTRALASNWARYNINVNAIAPGVFDTPLVKQARADHPSPFEEALNHIPFGRFGKPEEIGPVAVFLASEASRYMTGSTLVIDGGCLLW